MRRRSGLWVAGAVRRDMDWIVLLWVAGGCGGAGAIRDRDFAGLGDGAAGAEFWTGRRPVLRWRAGDYADGLGRAAARDSASERGGGLACGAAARGAAARAGARRAAGLPDAGDGRDRVGDLLVSSAGVVGGLAHAARARAGLRRSCAGGQNRRAGVCGRSDRDCTRPQDRLLVAPTMARASNLESRLQAILDPRTRRRAVGRRAAALVAAAALLALIPLAGVRLRTGVGLTGVVYDKSGAVVPGATISATDNASGAKQTTESNPLEPTRFQIWPPGAIR